MTEKCGISGGSAQDITVDYDLNLKLKVCFSCFQLINRLTAGIDPGYYYRSYRQ